MVQIVKSILSKKVSTFCSLMVLILIASIIGAVIIQKSQKLAELQKPLPFYISTSTVQF